MALKKEFYKRTKNKSKLMIFFAFPIILIGAIIGIFAKNNNIDKEITKKEKEYQYEYEYDNNWEEVLNEYKNQIGYDSTNPYNSAGTVWDPQTHEEVTLKCGCECG